MNNLESRKRPNRSLLPADRIWQGVSVLSSRRPLKGEKTIVKLFDLLGAVQNGKWIILLTCGLISAVVVIYELTETKIYEATSLVSIATSKTASTTVDRVSMYPQSERSQADELSFLTNSGDLARRVAQRLRHVAEGLGSDTLFTSLQSVDGRPPTIDEVALRLLAMVQFMPAEKSMIVMKAFSPSRHEAIRLVNIYAEEYRLNEQERSRARLVSARDLLRDRLDARREELTRLDYEWEALVRSGDAILEGSQGEVLVQQFGQLMAKLESQGIQLESERRQLEHLRGEYERVAPDLVKQIISGVDEEIDALNRHIAELKVEAEVFYIHDPTRRGREAEVPELKEIVDSIVHLEAKKNALADELVAQTLRRGSGSSSGAEPLSYTAQIGGKIVEKELAINEIESTIRTLQQRVSDVRAKLDRVPSKTLKRQDVERRRAVVEQWYRTLQKELQQTEIALESETGNVSLVNQAQTAAPVGNGFGRDLIVGMLLGLGLGTGIVFIFRAIDRRIQRPCDVKDMGFNLVGVIPEMKSEIRPLLGENDLEAHDGNTRDSHLISVLRPESPIAENYRLTRTNIDFLFEDHPPRVVLITSPESGDGKSVTAVNLAATIAESGRRTLIIDMDLRRPSCHELLGVRRAPGFVDLLMNAGEFPIDAFSTTIRNLHFIPSGSASTRPSELISSSMLRDGLHDLRELFDTIVIDSPPVLAVSDAVVLAPFCDATIIVANAAVTDQQALSVTRQTLEAVGVQVAGVILNRFDVRSAGIGGYSIYGYDGGYGNVPELSNAPIASARSEAG